MSLVTSDSIFSLQEVRFVYRSWGMNPALLRFATFALSESKALDYLDSILSLVALDSIISQTILLKSSVPSKANKSLAFSKT